MAYSPLQICALVTGDLAVSVRYRRTGNNAEVCREQVLNLISPGFIPQFTLVYYMIMSGIGTETECGPGKRQNSMIFWHQINEVGFLNGKPTETKIKS